MRKFICEFCTPDCFYQSITKNDIMMGKLQYNRTIQLLESGNRVIIECVNGRATLIEG